jgi:hypothetical protein
MGVTFPNDDFDNAVRPVSHYIRVSAAFVDFKTFTYRLRRQDRHASRAQLDYYQDHLIKLYELDEFESTQLRRSCDSFLYQINFSGPSRLPLNQRVKLSQEVAPQPPAKIESLLYLLLRGDQRDAVLGDVAERYGERYKSRGAWHAKLWLYGQVACSLLPLLKQAIFKRWLHRLS